MKKLLSLSLVLILSFSLSTSALAGENLTDDEPSVKAQLPQDRSCEHTYNYLLQEDSFEATDTEGGYRHYICSVCGTEYAYTTDPLVYADGYVKQDGSVVNVNAGNKGAVNPNFPLWERIPDAEPHVFWSKADHEWRLYVYGDHDTGPVICSEDQVLWSAPVYDLSDWRFDGQIIDTYEKEGAENLKLNALFAPDADYDLRTDTFYLVTFEVFDAEVLRRSTAPEGRFDEEDSIVYSFCDETGWGPYVTTDPALYIENGIIYVLASCSRMDLSSAEYVESLYAAEGLKEVLNKATKDGNSSMQLALICQMKEDPSQGVEKVHFCSIDGKGYLPVGEAASLRYDDESGYYIMVYYGNELGDSTADGRTTGLAYIYTDDLMNGEWIMGDNTLGGNVIYDNNGVYLKDPENGVIEKSNQHTFTGGNNHGGMVKANGEWYISGHVNGDLGTRLNTFEKIELIINDDGSLTIPAVEMTSSGAADSLDAFEIWEAGIACYIVSGQEGNDDSALSAESSGDSSIASQEESSGDSSVVSQEESSGDSGESAADSGGNNATSLLGEYKDNTISSHGYAGVYDMSVIHVTPMTNIDDGDILGYKYLDFGEEASLAALNLLVAQKEECSDGSVEVWLDAPSGNGGTRIGSVEISREAIAASGNTETGSDGSFWTWVSGEMETEVSGIHGVYFVFSSDTAGASVCDMDSFGFSR